MYEEEEEYCLLFLPPLRDWISYARGIDILDNRQPLPPVCYHLFASHGFFHYFELFLHIEQTLKPRCRFLDFNWPKFYFS